MADDDGRRLARESEAKVEQLLQEVSRLQAQVESFAKTSQQGEVASSNPLASAVEAAQQVPDAKWRGTDRLVPPGNFHQVTAVRCLDNDSPAQRRVLRALSSFAVLALQMQVLIGVTAGASNESCRSNVDCGPGWICAARGACVLCLDNGVNDGKTAWWADDATNATAFCSQPNLADYPDGVAGCDACYDPAIGSDTWNRGRNSAQEIHDAVSIMRSVDWLALVLVSLVVGLNIASELEDIKLCQFLAQQRGGESESSLAASPAWVRPALFMLAAARQFGFLPMVSQSIPALVMWRGSDALSICFNGLAVLFLLEIDDILFAHFMPSSARAEILRTGRPIIGEAEANLLAVTKPLHAVVVAFVIVSQILIAGLTSRWQHGMPMMFGAFWLCGLAEAATNKTGNDENVVDSSFGKRFGVVLVSALLGLGWLAVMAVTSGEMYEMHDDNGASRSSE